VSGAPPPSALVSVPSVLAGSPASTAFGAAPPLAASSVFPLLSVTPPPLFPSPSQALVELPVACSSSTFLGAQNCSLLVYSRGSSFGTASSWPAALLSLPSSAAAHLHHCSRSSGSSTSRWLQYAFGGSPPGSASLSNISGGSSNKAAFV
jgi:hypothetical protein